MQAETVTLMPPAIPSRFYYSSSQCSADECTSDPIHSVFSFHLYRARRMRWPTPSAFVARPLRGTKPRQGHRTGRGRLLNDLQDENGARWAAARCSSLLMRHSERIVSSRCWQSSLLGFPGFVPIASERSDSIEDQATFIPYMDPCHQFFARQSQNHGWVISSARTHRSKFSGLRKPSATAASLRLLPSLCAFFAICAALS